MDDLKYSEPDIAAVGTLKHSIRVYCLYFLQFLKARLEYKADFLASLLASIVSSLTGLAFVYILIDGTTVQSLGGWSRGEVMFIYGYSYLPMALFSVVALNLYGFGDRYVIQGQCDRVLLRPLNSLLQVVFESFNLESIGNFLVGVSIRGFAMQELDMTLSVLDVLWIIVSSVSGALILLSVFVVVSSLSFHFEDRLGIAAPVFNLATSGRYPLPVFNKVIQFLLSVIIPFGFVAFYPSTHFFKSSEFGVLSYLSPFVALIALLVAAALWRIGVAKYGSTGS